MFNKRLLYVPDTNPETTVTVETLVIGGGGGGGQIIGGGGGAGGIVSSSIVYKPEIEYAVLIGAGGKGSIGYSTAPDTENGNPTTISGSVEYEAYSKPFIRWWSGSSSVELYSSRSLEAVVAYGGGMGSGWSDTLGVASLQLSNIGCGGGGSSHSVTAAAPGIPSHNYQGYRGGYGSGHAPLNGTDGGGGGGGGLGAVGVDPPTNGSVGGNGGIGIILQISASAYVGGGGGGGTRSSTGNNYSNNGTGGALYGGGRGGYQSVAVGATGGATSGTAHTGGGGGCGGYSAGFSGQQGGNGGSGLAIFKLLTSEYSGSTGGAQVHTTGAYTIVNFRQSGTITFKK